MKSAAVLRQSDLERSNDAKHNHFAQEVREDFLNALHGPHDSNAQRHGRTIRICPLHPLHFIFLLAAVQVLSKARMSPVVSAAAD